MVPTEDNLDGYVRIAEAELPGLKIHHLISEVDASIAIAENLADTPSDLVTGYTEWTGNWRGATASLGWDWGYIHQSLSLVNIPEIRTNILLLGQDGSAQPPLLCRLRLSQWLESVPWQLKVMQEIHLDK